MRRKHWLASPLKIEGDGMTAHGWTKNPCPNWAALLDGRRFDQKNKPVALALIPKIKPQKRGQRATKKEIERLLSALERKKREKKWTWLKMAKKIGINYQTVRNWRGAGTSCNPSQQKIKNISKLLEDM